MMLLYMMSLSPLRHFASCNRRQTEQYFNYFMDRGKVKLLLCIQSDTPTIRNIFQLNVLKLFPVAEHTNDVDNYFMVKLSKQSKYSGAKGLKNSNSLICFL